MTRRNPIAFARIIHTLYTGKKRRWFTLLLHRRRRHLHARRANNRFIPAGRFIHEDRDRVCRPVRTGKSKSKRSRRARDIIRRRRLLAPAVIGYPLSAIDFFVYVSHTRAIGFV